MKQLEEKIWAERYRPTTVDECILPQNLKNDFLGFVQSGDMPNLLLVGPSGVGKTTVAMALCNQLGYEVYFVPASERGNIDTLRNDIRDFVSTVSLSGGRKAVLLDEADGLNPQSTQPALRSFIQEFAESRFILTANFKNKILAAIPSRCAVIEFKFDKAAVKALMPKFMQRVQWVLAEEKVKYDPKVVAAVIQKFFPDMRRILNELQRYGQRVGGIDEGVLSSMTEMHMDQLMIALRAKDWKLVRQWVAENIDNEFINILRAFYDNAYEMLKPEYIPQTITLLQRYQFESATSADMEICLAAFLVEIMASGAIKDD